MPSGGENAEDSAESLKRASRGDARAAEQLVAAWSPMIERYLKKHAAKSVLARESAADLAQSVCREALERFGRGELEFRGEAALRHWLYGAADLKVRNRLRYYGAAKRGEQPIPTGGADDASEGALPFEALAHDPGPTPSRAAAALEDRAAFDAALARLEDRQRAAVELFHFEGLGHKEIAERLGISEGNSRTLLARALARLARFVREEGGMDSSEHARGRDH